MTDADKLTQAIAALRDIREISGPYERSETQTHVAWRLVNSTATQALNRLTRQDNAR